MSFKSLFPEGATTFRLVVLRIRFDYTDHSQSALQEQPWKSAAPAIYSFEFSNCFRWEMNSEHCGEMRMY